MVLQTRLVVLSLKGTYRGNTTEPNRDNGVRSLWLRRFISPPKITRLIDWVLQVGQIVITALTKYQLFSDDLRLQLG